MTFTRARSLGRDLLGRNGKVFTESLLGQLDATIEAAELARSVAEGEMHSRSARRLIVDIEHRGDEHRRRLVLLLSRALAPPMDREDLFRLSRSVDDVLDNLRDLVREMDLFGVSQERLLVRPLKGVEAGVHKLREAVLALLDDPSLSRLYARDARKSDIRPSFQKAMAMLLVGDQPVTNGVLKRRELLRRVDSIGLRMADAANALTDGSVKRSQ